MQSRLRLTRNTHTYTTHLWIVGAETPELDVSVAHVLDGLVDGVDDGGVVGEAGAEDARLGRAGRAAAAATRARAAGEEAARFQRHDDGVVVPGHRLLAVLEGIVVVVRRLGVVGPADETIPSPICFLFSPIVLSGATFQSAFLRESARRPTGVTSFVASEKEQN